MISTYCSNKNCPYSDSCERSFKQVEEPRPTYFLSRTVINKMGFDCYLPVSEEEPVAAQGEAN